MHIGELPDPSHNGHHQNKEMNASIIEVKKAFLLYILSRHAKFEKKILRDNEWCIVAPPKDIADIIISRAGMWPLPPLRGIVRCPTLRADGSPLLTPGYDPQSHYYFDHNLHINTPDSPTIDEARKQLSVLIELLEGFPFVKPEDRSVALALIFSTVIRPSLDYAPLFAITSPTRGSGKSYLMDIASIISTGRPATVLSVTSDNIELEKRIIGCLLSGDTLINIDNFNGTLNLDILCQAITSYTLKIRPLGTSPHQEIPNTALWSVNGNNLIIGGDLSRRTLLCRLDSGCERPEERNFSFNPIKLVSNNRQQYVSAILTIFRAYIVSGQPDMGVKPFGGFEQWSSLVRGALLWLGEPDPCESRDAIMDEDPEQVHLRALLPLWHRIFGKKPVKIKQLIANNSTASEELLEIIDDIAGEGNGIINTRRLGRWLKRHKDRIVAGHKLVQFPGTNMATWQVVQAGETTCCAG